jgi:hypothetical protein
MATRIWWRLNSSTILILLALGVASGVLGIAYASNLRCDPGMSQAECTMFLNYTAPSLILPLVLAAVPIFAGVALGVVAIAGEIEGGTAPFAWSVGADRRRWLAEHVANSFCFVAAIGLVCGVLNAITIAQLNPGHDLMHSFIGYGMWGPISIMRGLCAYAVALLVGTVVRRVVASIAVSLVVVTFVVAAALIAGRSLEPAHLLPNGDPRISDAIGVGSGVLRGDGSFETVADCLTRMPSDLDVDEANLWQLSNCSEVGSYIEGAQVPFVELRESSILVLAGLTALSATFLLVTSRRPQP